MIKFFRHIRRSLIQENKMGKYFKYAIGEIILVMIGILLALQVNNWNEDRLAQKNELKILSQLNQDLRVNFEELSGIYDMIIKSNELGKKFFDHIENDKTYNDSIPYWISNFGGRNIFNNANTTYKNLENSQKSIITNDSIRIRITLMYEMDFANVHTREKYEREDYFPRFIKELHKNFKIGSTTESWLNGVFAEVNTPRDWEGLKLNDDFKNAVMELYNFRLLRINWLGETLKRLQLLIDDIDSEIEAIK